MERLLKGVWALHIESVSGERNGLSSFRGSNEGITRVIGRYRKYSAVMRNVMRNATKHGKFSNDVNDEHPSAGQ